MKNRESSIRCGCVGQTQSEGPVGRISTSWALLTAALIVAALLVLPASPAFSAPPAQAGGQNGGEQGAQPGRMRMRHGNMLEHLSRALNLTDQQKAQIKPILENEHKSMMALRQDTSLSRQDRMSKFMALHKETMSKIQPILTSEQQAKLQKMEQRREERMKQWHEQHSHGGAAPAPQN